MHACFSFAVSFPPQIQLAWDATLCSCSTQVFSERCLRFLLSPPPSAKKYRCFHTPLAHLWVSKPYREKSLWCFCCWGLPALVRKDGKLPPPCPSPYNPATPEEIYHLHKAVCLELVKRLTGTSAAGSDFSLRLFVRWETWTELRNWPQ